MKRRVLASLMVGAMVLLTASALQAATFDGGAGTGALDDATNWDGDVLPPVVADAVPAEDWLFPTSTTYPTPATTTFTTNGANFLINDYVVEAVDFGVTNKQILNNALPVTFTNVGGDDPSMTFNFIPASTVARNINLTIPLVIDAPSFLLVRKGPQTDTGGRALIMQRAGAGDFITVNSPETDLIFSNLNEDGTAGAYGGAYRIVFNNATLAASSFALTTGRIYLEAGWIQSATLSPFGAAGNTVIVGDLHGSNSGGVADDVTYNYIGAAGTDGYNWQLSSNADNSLTLRTQGNALELAGNIVGGAGQGVILDATGGLMTLSGTTAANGANSSIGEVNVVAGNIQVDGSVYGSVVSGGNVAVNGTWGSTVSGTTAEALDVTGDLVLGVDSVLDLVGDALDVSTTYVLATYGGLLSGEFNGLGQGAAVGAAHEIDYAYAGGTQIALVAVPVPEPGTLALLGVAGLLGLAVARRRRK